MILFAFHVLVSIGRFPLQIGCDIIGLLCDGINRKGFYAERL